MLPAAKAVFSGPIARTGEPGKTSPFIPPWHCKRS